MEKIIAIIDDNESDLKKIGHLIREKGFIAESFEYPEKFIRQNFAHLKKGNYSPLAILSDMCFRNRQFVNGIPQDTFAEVSMLYGMLRGIQKQELLYLMTQNLSEKDENDLKIINCSLEKVFLKEENYAEINNFLRGLDK